MRLVARAGAGRADTMGEFMDAASPVEASPERLFRTVSSELERTLWQVLMRPTSDDIHVLQLGAVVELMPNVYLQAVRLMYHKPFDRYVRLWCIVPASNGIEGDVEERTLLCFYTPGFPDPQFTEVRPGMDLNLAWLDSIRVRLSELLDTMDAQLLAEAADHRPAVQPPTTLNGTGRPAPADLMLATRPAALATPLPATTNGPATPAASNGTKRAELVAQHAEQVFEEMKRTRDSAYAERDRLDAALRDVYFTRYPFMRQAMQHSSELKIADLVGNWVRQGCPDPSATPAAAPAAFDPAATQVASTTTPAASTGPAPWTLAIELERTQALIAERKQLLEQLCEMTGGHFPAPRRDVESGRMLTICARCDAHLSAREPDASDDWMR